MSTKTVEIVVIASMPDAQPGASPQEQAILAEVLRAMRRVRHGYVQLVVQDARVIQIDTLERRRLEGTTR